MAKAKLKFHTNGFKELLTDPAVVADLERRAEAITEACNAASSWGGYYQATNAAGNRGRSRIWSKGRSDRPGSDRALRIVRNLDAGR